MQIGFLGLGKMGAGMVLRLVQAGHDVVGMDIDETSRATAEGAGASTVTEIDQLVKALDAPRTIWVMLPSGVVTQRTVRELADYLDPGDLVIDGGNSDFRDAPGHSAALAEKEVRFVDIGVSGGQWGWKNGYGLMVGADESTYHQLEPFLQALAAPNGYSLVGAIGSGHLVKAIHNGIQYGVLQAYAEGFALLSAHPEVDVVAAMTAWQGGSSIRSWLLEQMVDALGENPTLANVGKEVSDSGMGRWTAEEAIRLAVPTPVLTAALHARFTSRDNAAASKLLVAARTRIGGQKS